MRPGPAAGGGILLLSLLCTAAAAQEDAGFDDFEELDMENLLDRVSSAARHTQDIAESPSAITVIGREQIVGSSCTDVPCLLRQVPELDVVDMTASATSVGARALTDALGDKGLVLVDGLEVNQELLGMPNWRALPVHVEDIERIEVIRGPGSALYGANAHSFVVSITSRRAARSGAEVFVGLGERGTQSMNLRVGAVLGRWNVVASGGLEGADRWQEPGQPELENTRLRLLMERQGEDGRITAHLALLTSEGEYFTSMGPLRVTEGILLHALGGYSRGGFRSVLSFNLMDTDLRLDLPLFFEDLKMGAAPDRMPILTTGLDGEASYALEPWSGNWLLAGGNYRWNTLISDFNDPGSVHQHRLGLFLHDEQRLFERLLLTAGARLDVNSTTPVSFSPRLAAVWGLTSDQHLRLAFGQAFRKPSFLNTAVHMRGFEGAQGFEDLGDFVQRSIGNSDLDNESVTTLEAGYHGRFLDRGLVVEAVAFYGRYRGTISVVADFVTNTLGFPDFNRSTLRFENQGREADSVGGSVSLTLDLAPVLRANLNYTLRHSWYVTDPPSDTMAAIAGGKGDRVRSEPAHLLNGSLQLSPGSGFHLGVQVHGRTGKALARIQDGQLIGEPVAVNTPAAVFASAWLAWRLELAARWVELGVKVFNLLDNPFRDEGIQVRPDGVEFGGEQMGRRVLVFFRAAL